uniref:Uncharacterized protein n=1 Tax=Anopheles atroparvus TaxID=41427 RepID=A0AAG5D4P5_ANOAO
MNPGDSDIPKAGPACYSLHRRQRTVADRSMAARWRSKIAPPYRRIRLAGRQPEAASDQLLPAGRSRFRRDNYDALPTRTDSSHRALGDGLWRRWLAVAVVTVAAVMIARFPATESAAAPLAKSPPGGYGRGHPMLKRMGGMADSTRISNLTRLH